MVEAGKEELSPAWERAPQAMTTTPRSYTTGRAKSLVVAHVACDAAEAGADPYHCCCIGL